MRTKIKYAPVIAAISVGLAASVTAPVSAAPGDTVNKASFKPVETSSLCVRLSRAQEGFVPLGHYLTGVTTCNTSTGEPGIVACPHGYKPKNTKQKPRLASTTQRGWTRGYWDKFAPSRLVCSQPKKGLVTEFPAWFPENPTPDDIRKLGTVWSPQTPVAVGLTIPMPDLDTCTPAVLPTGYLTNLSDHQPYTEEWFDGIQGQVTATWRFDGGSGLMYQGPWHIGHPVPANNSNSSPADYLSVEYYSLNPEVPTEITVPSSLYDAGSVYNTRTKERYDAWYVGWETSAGVVPDCGQANLPPSIIRMWNIPRKAWNNKNAIAPDEYLAITKRFMGPRMDQASPTDQSKAWVSSPGTDDN